LLASQRKPAYDPYVEWVFLVLALSAGLVELHTGTFYLAAIAAVSFITFVLGFFLPDETLFLLFVALCFASLVLVWRLRKRLARGKGLRDLDAGEEVMITAIAPGGNHVVVAYRGARWDAVMDDGSHPEIGGIARIVRKNGNVLHLASLTPVKREPAQEIS